MLCDLALIPRYNMPPSPQTASHHHDLLSLSSLLTCTLCLHASMVTPPSHSTLCSTLYTAQVPYFPLQSLHFIPMVCTFSLTELLTILSRLSISHFKLDIRSSYSVHCTCQYTHGGYRVECYHVEMILTTELPLPPILES